EMLLLNHPLDCPICDQAGECELQNFAYNHGLVETRYEEERRTFEKIDIGKYIQLHMTRCILCYRCVYTADQLTNKRVHGVLGRGEASEIGTYIQNVVENDFSGNVVDVCPVGALTDKTFRFKQRVWFTKPVYAHRNCGTCCGEVELWYRGEEVLRITARKNAYNEVPDGKFICNTCRFETKETAKWTIEGPAPIDRRSVVAANKYVKNTIKPKFLLQIAETYNPQVNDEIEKLVE
ncbi:MAG: Fe-S-binding domain-containing protein, partial [Verrucomicrobia bacterium]|nr:Fe-S-binding domain-containing protein [Cytophagales bacterium]